MKNFEPYWSLIKHKVQTNAINYRVYSAISLLFQYLKCLTRSFGNTSLDITTDVLYSEQNISIDSKYSTINYFSIIISPKNL